MSRFDDFDDFDDFNEFDDFDDDLPDEEWDEQQWEEYFQKEDEQKRRLEELMDRYGYSEEGLRKAFEEMGYELPDEEDLDFDEVEDEIEDDFSIDELLEEQYENWSAEESDHYFLENSHPLFRQVYQLILRMLKIFRHIDVGYREHPLVTFQTGLFECMSKLIRAGYDNIDDSLETEKGLILAALKRSRRSLFSSLLTIPQLKEMQIISRTTLAMFRHEINDLLKQVNQEIIFHKNNGTTF